MLKKLHALVKRIDILLALLSISLWGMLWGQGYTNIDGITAILYRIEKGYWKLFTPIKLDSTMSIVISIFYWICLAVVIFLVILLFKAGIDVLLGHDEESKRKRQIVVTPRHELRNESKSLIYIAIGIIIAAIIMRKQNGKETDDKTNTKDS